MDLLIDTSVLVSLERDDPGIATPMSRFGDDSVAIASITASELLHGVHRADSARRRGERERFVEAVLAAVAVLPFDLEVARVHARLWADLRRAGTPIGAHDLIIAATALTHDLTVVTGDERHFGRIEGLRVEIV